MDRDAFWQIVENAPGDDVEDRAAAVESELGGRSAEDIVAFDRHLSELMNESYCWELWGAGYIINGGCSDDGFDYFRGWLIMQGRKVYEDAMKDPDSLADIPDLEEDVECEYLLSAAWTAQKNVTGEEIPGVTMAMPELGEGWDFDDDDEMLKRYPKLCAKFFD